MKNYLLFILLLFSLGVFSQNPIVLNYETHDIRDISNNDMRLCNYLNPGEGGENVTWDFSSLVPENEFTGYVRGFQTAINAVNPFANTELEEFDNLFYFRVNNDRVEQYGYATKDNKVVVSYEKPSLKMKFPFTYGNNETGDFNGIINIEGNKGEITGTYGLTADGYGKLLLPDNYSAKNALRVKSVKEYTQNIGGSQQNYIITTYRWYVDYHRYPVLVLTEVKSGGTSVFYQAAMNNTVKATSGIEEISENTSSVKILPNPVKTSFNISFNVGNNSEVIFDIYSLTGEKIGNVLKEQMLSGTYKKEINADEIGMKKGVYILKAIIDDNSYTHKIIVE